MSRTGKLSSFVFPLLFVVAGPGTAAAGWATNGSLICTAANNQTFPKSVTDGSSGAIIAWTDGRNGNDDVFVQRVLVDGIVDPAWPANGRALCTAAGLQQGAAMTSDGAGGAIVTWYDHRSGADLDIYAQHVLASGAVDPGWPANGLAICTDPSFSDSPAIVSDGAGGAIIAWSDSRGGGDIYAQHVLASGVVDGGWPVNGRVLCVDGEIQSNPTIVSDGAGGAVVAWKDRRPGVGNFDIYAQRVLASGVVDGTWPANGRALCIAAGNQDSPVGISDGAGGAIVTWGDPRLGTSNSDLYAQHVLSSGAVDGGWPVNGRALCTAPLNQTSPQLVADGAGGAIVTWADARGGGGTTDIYAQHVLASGAVDGAWPLDGSALSLAASNQSLPRIATDGAGGAFVAWEDQRGQAGGTGPTDVYAQHVLSSGTVAFLPDGQAVSVLTGGQERGSIVSNGVGGAIITWHDSRSGDLDIYAGLVGPNVVPGWSGLGWMILGPMLLAAGAFAVLRSRRSAAQPA